MTVILNSIVKKILQNFYFEAHDSKNLEVRQKYSATHRIFNSLSVFDVMKHCLVFDILHKKILEANSKQNSSYGNLLKVAAGKKAFS